MRFGVLPCAHPPYEGYVMSIRRRSILAAVLALPVAGCGFRLRGSFSLPFESLYLDVDRNTPFGSNLVRTLTAGSSVKIVDAPNDAEAVLKILKTDRTRTVTALNSKGEGREYELAYKANFRVTTPMGEEFLADTAVQAQRTITYSDSDYLSRETEEAALYADMENDLVSQIMRRIERVKPVK